MPSHAMPDRSSRARAILVVRGLSHASPADGSRVRGVTSPHIRRRLVRGKYISVLLHIRGVLGFGLALPELPLWRAGCVAVVGGGAEGLLFAVVAHEEELEDGGEEEEDTVEHVSVMFWKGIG